MKKVVFVLAIPLAALMFMFFTVDRSFLLEDQLIGTWKGTDFEFQQLEGPNTSQAMIDGGRNLHERSAFIMKEDHTYEYRVGSSVNGQGTWSVEGTDKLVTKDANDETTQYQIVTLNDRTLTTRHENQADTPDGTIQVAITLTYEKK